MNTKTLITIKTDKQIKKAAQKTAGDIGIPLGTVINALLRQFVREKGVSFSTRQYTMTPHLESLIREAEADYAKGATSGPFKSARETITHLRKKNS